MNHYHSVIYNYILNSSRKLEICSGDPISTGKEVSATFGVVVWTRQIQPP